MRAVMPHYADSRLWAAIPIIGNAMNFTEPVSLHGRHVSLVPLSHSHHDDLVEAVKDGELWSLWYTKIPAPEGLRAEIDRRLELQRQGSYRKRVQRSALNTECKLLLLTHAFEQLNCIAVEFRTHFFNQQSRAAIERLGAKLDGVLRQHQIAGNGTLRDTCVYSILDREWPTVKAHLSHRLTPS